MENWGQRWSEMWEKESLRECENENESLKDAWIGIVFFITGARAPGCYELNPPVELRPEVEIEGVERASRVLGSVLWLQRILNKRRRV